MSRLLRPNPGECVDRQTILELKAEHGQSLDPQQVTDHIKQDTEAATVVKTVMLNPSKVNIKPFLDEHEAIQRYLEEYYFPNIQAFPDRQTSYDSLYKQLGEVNSGLWNLEDQARILRAAPDKHQEVANQRAAEVLFTITEMNDKRSELVKQINAIWNINSQEKLY